MLLHLKIALLGNYDVYRFGNVKSALREEIVRILYIGVDHAEPAAPLDL